jgi:acyl transferase domain-containing protein
MLERSVPAPGRREIVPDEVIAIVGAACLYPGGCDDPDAFWDFLRRGGSAVREVPATRWARDFYDPDPDRPGKTASRWGGFLPDPFPGAFDAAFFDISPKEAAALDPQQRLLLEVGWRALEDAGVALDPDRGKPFGVFVGISTTDYHGAKLWQPGSTTIDPFTATGASFAAAAGRLSYAFGFDGPSLAVDTACSSSLVALHLACQAIRQGECEAALVAGVNALLTPNLFICLTKMGLLSPDGHCKAFDAAGNGYVRAEGCGAVVLKTLGQAQRDGDRILALCRGSAVNQDGRSNGLTAPSRKAQERVIGQALARAGVSGDSIAYVEAHGTGTPLGDMIELSALAGTYAAGRDPDSPLLVGSVKTNIGHLEAGAGMAGLIKTMLCLRHGEIPAHLHLQTPTPHHPWDEVALTVPTALTPWPGTAGPRRAGISSFGFSGTNAHVILEEPPAPEAREMRRSDAVLLPLSARSPAALEELAAGMAGWLEAAPRNLADVGFTLGAGRTAFAHRLAVVGSTAAELAAALRGTAPSPADGDSWRRRLGELAALWTAGEEVDWARLYRPLGAGKIALPGHPFRRQHYWIDPVVGVPAAAGAQAAAAPQPSAPRPATYDGPDGMRRRIDHIARKVLSDQPLAPLDPELPLVEQGFTSLMALELRRELEAELAMPVPATFLYNYPTIIRMAEFFLADRSFPATAAAAPPPADGDYDFLDELSVEDLATLIEREVDLP